MRELVAAAGLSDRIEVQSAGTGDWHVGQPPDHRAAAAAARRGIQLTGTARQIAPEDFEHFDLILAVDEENLQRLRRLAPSGAHAEVRTLDCDDVPDPYYGGPDGFEQVLDQVTAACTRLLDQLRADERGDDELRDDELRQA